MRVLLVEDDQSVADGLLDGLSGGEFETRHVTTGAAALESLAEFNPEIVLLDLGLPDMDGRELCKLMRREGRRLAKLAAAEAAAAEATTAEGSAAGVDFCLPCSMGGGTACPLPARPASQAS